MATKKQAEATKKAKKRSRVEYDDVSFWNAPDAHQAGEQLVSLMTEDDAEDTMLRENTRRMITMFEYGANAAVLETGAQCAIEDETNGYNMARNFIETMVSKICKTTVSPMAMTEGGGFMERRRARKVDKALEGEFEEHEVDRIKEDIVTDAMVTDHGAGFAKVYERDECIRIEHVPAEDIRFDRREVRLRQPRSIFQLHDMDKYELAHLYPEHEDAILKAAGRNKSSDAAGEDDIGQERVRVYEGWHRRSGKDATDGRHVMAIAGATLVDEQYDEDGFPFAEFVPRRRRRSVWGLSAMRDCAAPQKEYEKLTAKIQKGHTRLGMAGFIGPKSAEVNLNEIVGEYGIYIEHAGPSAPTPFSFDPITPGTYAYRESLVRDMGTALGVSQFSAQSQVPAGLSQASGKALQVFEDQEDGRMVPYHRELQRWVVRLSWLVIRLAKRMTDRGIKLEAKYRDKHGWEKIDWSEVVKDADSLILKVFPVSNLAKQPAARFAQLQELLNAGAITVEQFKRLFDIPDLESELGLETADTDVIDMMLEGIVFEGKVHTPEPFDDLQQLIDRGSKFYQLCRVRNVPDDRMQLLREFILQAKTLKQKAEMAAQAAAPPPPMPGPGMLPEAVPGMPALPMPPGGGAPPQLPPAMPQVAA